jgi:hypothetical protein
MGGRLPAADVLSVGLGRRRRKGAAPDQVAGDVAELQRYTLGAEDFLHKKKINRSINQSFGPVGKLNCGYCVSWFGPTVGLLVTARVSGG